MHYSLFKQIILVSIQSLRGQRLRTWLTAFIIAIGIMALVGILTAAEAIKATITSEFSSMGAQSFNIQSGGMTIVIGRRGQRPEYHENIPYHQAKKFKDIYQYPGTKTSLFFNVTGLAKLKFQNNATDENVRLVGGDENYLSATGYTIAEGRGFSKSDLQQNAQVAIIGKDVADKLFPNKSGIGELISYQGKRFRVIGLLKSKGSTLGFSGDRIVILPLTTAESDYAPLNSDFSMVVMTDSPEIMDDAIDEATLKMRIVRKLKPAEDNNFNITKSDNIANMVNESIGSVASAGSVIGFITLFGATISLMNIMLVSVRERTREIGTIKSLGAKKSAILIQFLAEAILICQLGGVLGVILGILMGNGVATLIEGTFVIPWQPILISGIVCFVVGVLAGILPAMKAARLDPIEALRHE